MYAAQLLARSRLASPWSRATTVAAAEQALAAAATAAAALARRLVRLALEVEGWRVAEVGNFDDQIADVVHIRVRILRRNASVVLIVMMPSPTS